LSNRFWNDRFLIVILPVIVLLFYITAAAHFGYTTDDAFIYLQFAKNLVNGNGISFNAGEPTYGITSPLWLFVISLGGWLGVDVYLAAKAIDLVIASGAVLLFYFVVFEVIRDSTVSVLATLAFSLNVGLLRWAGSGMETSLSVLLVLASFLCCLRNEYLLSTIFAVLLTLTRPEAYLFAGFIAYDIYINSHEKRRAIKLVTSVLLVYVVLLAPWYLYSAVTFGTVIPNTALAKSWFSADISDMFVKLKGIVNILGASDGIAIAGLVAAGSYLFWYFRKNALPDEMNEDIFYLKRVSILGIGWIIVIPLLYVIRHVSVVQRYLLLISPLILIFAFAFLFHALVRSRFRTYAYAVIVVFTGIIVVQSQTVYRKIIAPGVEAYEIGMNGSLISIGNWLRENTSPGESVFAWDIGALGYYSDRKVCDAAGLVMPEMIPYLRAGYSMKQMVDEKVYLRVCNPRYVVYCSDEPEELKSNPNLQPLMTKPFYGRGLLTGRLDYYTLYEIKDYQPHHKTGLAKW
jgi:hypothetical protein